MDFNNHLKFLLTDEKISPVIPKELQYGRCLTATQMDRQFWQKQWQLARLRQPCWEHINNFLRENNVDIVIGEYAEMRKNVYIGRQNAVHLGVDLVVQPATPVYAPLPGTIKEIKTNNSLGDYGTLVVLEHNIKETKFFTLYGHLAYKSCLQLKPYQVVEAGSLIGRVGDEQQNGGWPPHLHFQISSAQLINNLIFWGAVEETVANGYLKHCPDPNLLLKMGIN